MEREIGEENDKGFANIYQKVSRNHKATKMIHGTIKEYTKMKGQYTHTHSGTEVSSSLLLYTLICRNHENYVGGSTLIDIGLVLSLGLSLFHGVLPSPRQEI